MAHETPIGDWKQYELFYQRKQLFSGFLFVWQHWPHRWCNSRKGFARITRGHSFCRDSRWRSTEGNRTSLPWPTPHLPGSHSTLTHEKFPYISSLPTLRRSVRFSPQPHWLRLALRGHCCWGEHVPATTTCALNFSCCCVTIKCLRNICEISFKCKWCNWMETNIEEAAECYQKHKKKIGKTLKLKKMIINKFCLLHIILMLCTIIDLHWPIVKISAGLLNFLLNITLV